MKGEDEKKVHSTMDNGEPKTRNEGAAKVRKFLTKKGKMLTALSASLVFATTMMVGATACKKNKGGNASDSSTQSAVEQVEGLGLFYYDAGMEEYQISLLDGGKAIYNIGADTKMGTFTVNGTQITVKFDGLADMVATIDGNVMLVTQGDNQYKFYKRVYYKVSYEEDGGSEVADMTVVNGKTFETPNDPVKPGYEFLGWYIDSEYTAPYIFGSQIVTGDITLYAQWALVDPAMATYTIDFDLGYDAEAPATIDTKAGKIYDAPTPVREGYKFCGWWVSDYEDGTKLTYKWTKDTVFAANTTLFAVWEEENKGSKISNPEVQILADRIQWNGIDGASRYAIKITDPTGYVMVDQEVTSIEFAVDFASMVEGDYKVEVTAIASSGDANNADTIVRWYKNKAVGRVSKFSVINGTTLIYNRVPNAETYYISVKCGDTAHTHVMYNNGERIYYNFANCEMKVGGIEFTVTAVAEGYASVTSETFYYERSLEKVEGITVDEDTQIVSWYAVENATNYIVSVTCGNDAHTHMDIDVGAKTSFSLKECPAAADGKITVEVYAQTKGYNSPDATKYEYEKTKLATPGNIVVSNVDKNYVMTWDAVAGAEEYVIMVGNQTITTSENTCDITEAIAWVADMNYQVSIKAKSATNESVWSDPVDVLYYTMSKKIKYKAGVVSWEPVLGATGYEVRVNNAPSKKIANGDNFAEVELTQAGSNTIYVRFFDETKNYYDPNWVSIVVEDAQEIVFDHRNADAEKPADISYQYKVTGDKITMPIPTRAGYAFAGWYNTAKGPESNGQKFEDGYFTENQDMILYAYWVPATFQVNYVVGGDGTLPDGVVSGDVCYTKDFQLAVPKTEGDTVFLGWFLGTTTSSEQITDNRGYSIKPWAAKSDATVYALYINKVLEFTLLEDGTYSVMRGVNATKVAAIEIPDTYNSKPVTVVDGFAFQNCTKLVSLTIPNSVTLVEYSAFQGCKRLEEIIVKDVIANSALATYWSVDGVLIHKDELTGHTQIAYYPQAKQGAYTVPEGVTEIPMNLFEKTQITEITISASTTVIRKKAFYNCSTLKKITFAPGGTDNLVIEDGAFQNCAYLSAITLPARLSELQINEETHTMTMFSGCSALTHINIELGNQIYASNNGIITNKAGNELIFCPTARAGAYTVPQGIESIAPYAFYGCQKLTVITIPGYVKTIGDYAFANCTRVARVEFVGGAVAGMKTNIGEGSFADMSNLKSIIFDTGSVVNSIGERAFANAIALRELTIPTSLTYIGDYAFENAASLHEVSFANGDQGDLKFGSYVFSECKGLVEINLPKSVTELNLGVFDGCTNIANVFVSEDNEYYKDIEGVVYSKDGSVLMFFPKGRAGNENGAYVIPEGVTTISEGAFKGMLKITTIEIPNTVTMIGKNAFANSGSLKSLTFAEGNDTEKLVIDDSAFAGCGAIETVALPERTQAVGEKAFYSTSMTSITFPAGLETIGNYAFARTAITAVEVPAGIANMGESVFAECLELKSVTFANGYAGTTIPVGMFYGSAIETVNIPGSITAIGFGAFADCTALTRVIFEDGTADLAIGVAATTESGAAFNEKGVFAGCSALKDISLPDRVTVLGRMTFSNCTVLPGSRKEVVEVDGEKQDVVYDLISKTSRLTRIGDNAFENCKALGSIYIPGTVQNSEYVDDNTSQEYAIGNKAFYGASISTMTFGEGKGDLSFGYQALGYVSKATYDFPARLAPIYVIEEYPDGTKVASWKEGIDRTTFDGNSSIANINVAEGGEYYGSHEGALYKMEELDGKYVKAILFYVPKAYKGLNTNYTLNIPYTVRAVEDYAAQACTSMRYLNFEATPDGITPVDLTIGAWAFKGWTQTNFKTLNLPERLTYLGQYAFDGCTKLQSVTFPSTLVEMNETGYQFNGCTYLKSITFAEKSTLKNIPSNAFKSCGTNASYKLTTVAIPASVESIGSSAFDGCKYINTLTFGDNSQLKSIGYKAFNTAVITTLALPDNITTLNQSAFGTLANLTKLQLPKSLSSISTVENGQDRFLFIGLSNLAEVQVGGDDNKNEDGVYEGNYYSSKDGVLYNKDFTEIVYYPVKKAISTIEDKVDENGKVELDEDGNPVKVTVEGKYVVPAGVQSIGAYAFNGNAAGHSSLKHLVISKGVVTIAYKAFYKCSKLTEITFEEGRLAPLVLGDSAFQGCTTFKGTAVTTGEGDTATTKYVFTIPSSVVFSGQNIFASCAFRNIVFEKGNESTSLNSTFNGCTLLESVTNIPIVESMNSTFSGCSALKTVTFEEEKYEMISEMRGTFYECTSLKSITLPNVGALYSRNAVNTVWSVNSSSGKSGFAGVFQGCSALEEVIFTGDCGLIGVSTFESCKNLKSLKVLDANGNLIEGVPSNVGSIGDGAFYKCTSLTSIALTGGIEVIPTYAFYGCTGLTEITLPDFVSTIAKNAFYGCTNLTDVKFGAGLVTIGESAFQGATKLANVDWNDGLETIGVKAFYNAQALTEITLPASVLAIEESAFANCSNLASVTVQNGITSIGSMAFANCSSLTAFAIPGTLETLGIGAFSGCTNLTNVSVDGTNTNYSFDNGILYNTMKTAIIFVFPSVTGDVEIPGSVLAIGEGAFQNTTITSIVLPDTITEIPANAFKGCKQLASVKMPMSLEKIGAHAFEGCTSLTSITIPKTVYSTFEKDVMVSDRGNITTVTKDVDGIGAYAFANCKNLENVIFEAGGTQRLSIGDYAFDNCINLKGTFDENTKKYVFTIPYRVRSEVVMNWEQENAQQNYKFEQSIGIYAFANCTSLTNVVFEETGAGTFQTPVMIQIGAFYQCTSLESVKFSSHVGDYKTFVSMKGSDMPVWRIAVQNSAFEGCRSLTEVVLNGSFKNGISFAETAFKDSAFEIPKDFVVEPGTEMCEDRGEKMCNSWEDSYYVYGAQVYVPGEK